MTKVLYVEHNDDNRYMLKTRLELLGDFEVLAADDSEKGLEMPVLDRWEALRTLKQSNPRHPNHRHVRVCAGQRARGGDCHEFDAKPIDFVSLLATIRRVLAKPK